MSGIVVDGWDDRRMVNEWICLMVGMIGGW